MSTANAFTGLNQFNLSSVELTQTKLGSGSYASVYVVHYLGLKCAGKKLHDILLEQGGGATYALSRFEEECRILSQLRHPNIVQFLGVFFEEGVAVPILVMEFLPTNLTSCIEKNGALRPSIGYSILHDVALGLNYLHSHKPCIVHRDLSSNNVLLTSDMKAKISDLGVAKILNLTPLQVSHIPRHTQAPGTAAYMPPEALIANPKYDTTIDMFSFGVLVIHVFSGQWPEPQGVAVKTEGGKMIPVSEAERRDIFLKVVGKGHPLMDLVQKCIDNDPNVRPRVDAVLPLLREKLSSSLFPDHLEMLQRMESAEKQLPLIKKQEKQLLEIRQENEELKRKLEAAIKEKRQASGGKLHSSYENVHTKDKPPTASATNKQPSSSPRLVIGSRIQIPTKSNSLKYGVIRWIGNLPEFKDPIAGLEMDECMDGCTDGTWLRNKKRYFTCPPRKGFFYQLANLQADARAGRDAPSGLKAERRQPVKNPLGYAVMEEECDQCIVPGLLDKYLGEAKGIQGHQNSCYLDSTVFGLFALSDVFDSMFLDPGKGDQAGDDVKHLLWKGIVNPLRKNGLVRCECIERLRRKLNEMGKMEGHREEENPLEFLNVLLKLSRPFLSIERPTGVEQQYLITVENDKCAKLATISELLKKTFQEQSMRLKKLPGKVLIQVQHGREATTIPNKKLDLSRLLCSKDRCFMCGNSAWKKCCDCNANFTSNVYEPLDVVYFCQNCSELVHRTSTDRAGHKVAEVTQDSGGDSELDLLSVICIETSHYICFTRSEERWVFFDSMASRVGDGVFIPKVVDCTDVLNEWVYPANGDMTRLLNTPPKELPEYVRRFTQDIYLVVYIQPDFALYGDSGDVT